MSPDSDLVRAMPNAAVETVFSSERRPVVNSDRGADNRWSGWLSRVLSAELIRSMSRKGSSADNAACEGSVG